MIRIVKRLIRWLAILLLIIIIALLSVLFFITQSHSQLSSVKINPFQDIKMLSQLRQDWLAAPRQLNAPTQLKLTQVQLNKALVLQLSGQPATEKWQSAVNINETALNIDLEIPINLVFTQRYLPINIHHTFNQWQQPLTSVMIKNMPLPSFILDAINSRLLQKLNQQQVMAFIQQAQLQLIVEPGQLILQFLWIDKLQQRFPATVGATNLSDAQSIYAVVAEKINQRPNKYIELSELFRLIAQQQLATQNSDAARDFWLVAASVMGDQRLVNLAGLEYIKVNKRITLNQRVDLAQHFIYSGFLEQNAGSLLANSIGAFKEQLDAKNKTTKFSYSDSAANQAGIIFAIWLANNHSNSLLALSQLKQDRQIMIDVSHLAEGIDLPAAIDYQRQMQSLKKQIKSLPLYQR